MPIDPLSEELICFSDAAKLFPANSRGKHPHVSSIYRYASRGVRRVVLESIRCGGTRATSSEAVARFIARLSDARSIQRPAASATGSDNEAQLNGSRSRDELVRAEAVEVALDEIGIRTSVPPESEDGGAR